MLTARDITLPGFYWHFDVQTGVPPCVVEIVGEARRDLEVRWPGREDADALAELAGGFVGPLHPPAAS